MAAAKLAERLVAEMPLFRSVARNHLARLLEHVTIHRLKRGGVILRRGERPSAFFGVAQGQVKLTLRGLHDEEKLLRDSGMAIIPADNINDGAKKVVEAVKAAA